MWGVGKGDENQIAASSLKKATLIPIGAGGRTRRQSVPAARGMVPPGGWTVSLGKSACGRTGSEGRQGTEHP